MKIERLLHILYVLLNNEKVTINYLAEKFEVSRRTIFRDLESLNASGIPIVSYPGVGGGVGIMEGFKIDKSLFDNDDIATILTGLNSLKGFGDDKKIEYLIHRIVPAEKQNHAFNNDVIIDLSSWFEKSDTHGLVIDFRYAIANYLCLELKYHSHTNYSERIVEPYKLVFKYDDWYLFAYCQEREGFRLFKLNRISYYTVLKTGFTPKALTEKDLSFVLPMKHIPAKDGQELFNITLQYNLQNKEFLIDKLGAQYFTDYDDMGQIEFQTGDLSWAADLVISLQDKVKVIRPDSLKNDVLLKTEKMRRQYE